LMCLNKIIIKKKVLIIKQFNFNFGKFEYNEIQFNSIPIIKGKFLLTINPKFPDEFKRPFWFYNLEKKLKIDDIISLGPYYPKNSFNDDLILIPTLKYPAFSDITFSSKSGPLYRAPSRFIRESRKEQLRIISNFYANYLKNIIETLNYNEIIPVPAKPEYSFNSVEIISSEFSNVFNISMNSSSLVRMDNKSKEYSITCENEDLDQKKILLIDDIITSGETKDKIFIKLNEKGYKSVDMITLARTDHNIYEYNE